MIHRLFLYVSLLLIGMSISVMAGEKVKFGTFPIPLMVEDGEHGVFIELTKTIAQKAKIEIEIVISPPKRTMSYFTKQKVDAIFPALDINFPEGTSFEKANEIIYIKEDFVFTKKGSPLYKVIPDLEGKKIGITSGYPYTKELTDNHLIQLEPMDSDEVNAQKLIKGRIDGFVVEEKSGLKAFEKTGLQSQIQYDPGTPLSKQDVYYAFQATDKGRELSRRISDVLKQMKQDGTFAEIMKKATPK
jgi:polar amino acid transport system substrate-binding protein